MPNMKNYCSEKLSRLLGEKGFDFGMAAKYADDEYGHPRCTYWDALEWLRNEHNLFIDFGCNRDDEGLFWFYDIIPIHDEIDMKDCPEESFVEFNDAVEGAIKYTIENWI